MGRCKSPGSPESFFYYSPQLPWGQYLCFLHPELLSSPGREWLQFWWLLNHRYSSPSWVPLGSGAHIQLQLLMTVTSLFTDMAGNTPFLTITVFVAANDHMIVGSIYNYLFHYPFSNVFAHNKHLHSLPYLTSYKTYTGAVLCGKSSRWIRHSASPPLWFWQKFKGYWRQIQGSI